MIMDFPFNLNKYEDPTVQLKMWTIELPTQGISL